MALLLTRRRSATIQEPKCSSLATEGVESEIAPYRISPHSGDVIETGHAGPEIRLTDFRIVRLGPDDLESAALVHRMSFDERLPWLVGLHTPDEDLWFYRERVYVDCALWGAIQSEALVGIIAFRRDWIDQFYVLPRAQGRGVGLSLLTIAKSQAESLSLWTFQRNIAARQFYERRGFSIVGETNGSGNEEREPDVLYRWLASDRACQ